MIFNSYIFLFVFLPITLLIFRLSSYHYGKRTAIAVLGIASFIYYGWWNPPYIFLLLASIIFNFYFADIISRANKKKHLLALGILLNLVLLGYFKYAGFLIFNINLLFKGNYELGQILLPIGISFFTFQQIAYLSDISNWIDTLGGLRHMIDQEVIDVYLPNDIHWGYQGYKAAFISTKKKIQSLSSK